MFDLQYCGYTGTELCTVVETMYSYEVLFSVTGDTVFGKLLLRVRLYNQHHFH